MTAGPRNPISEPTVYEVAALAIFDGDMTIAMVMTIGISALIGVALGSRFNVFILIPTIILAAVCTAVIQAVCGDLALSVLVTTVLVVTMLQIGYLVGIIAHAAFEGHVSLVRNTDVALNILAHMEVVGSDGESRGIGRRACRNRRSSPS